MPKSVGAAYSNALTNVSAIGKMNSLGHRDNDVGMLFESRSYVSKELVHIEVSLGKVNEVGSDSVYYSSDCCRSGKPARITSHDLNDGNRLCGVYRAVADDLLHGGCDIFSRRAKAGCMVGNDKVIVDGLGNTDDPHLVIVSLGILGKLCNGIHRIVSANIEEVSDVVFLEYLKELFVNLVALSYLRKLLTARAKRRRRCVFKLCYKLVVLKKLGKIYESFLKKSLNAVLHSVKSLDSATVNALLNAANNSRQGCIYRRSRTTRLTNDRITNKHFIFQHSIILHINYY